MLQRGLAAIPVAAFLLAISTSVQASVKISSKPTKNMSCSAGVCSPTAKNAVLNVGDLVNMLADGDVRVTCGRAAQDIEIDAGIGWAGAARLTLDAYHSIAFNKPVTVTGTGALTITTNDGGSGGDFQFFGKGHVEFWDLTGSLIVNGHTYALVKSLGKLKKLVKHNIEGFYALAKSIDEAGHQYSGSPVAALEGIFEGLGNSISNLAIDSDDQYVGLFGELFSPGSIRNVRLLSVNINGFRDQQAVGSLVGFNHFGTVANSSSTGIVSSSGTGSLTGGLVGLTELGTIERSQTSVSVSASGNGSTAGGLVGLNDDGCAIWCAGELVESYATGTVSGGSGAIVGGLVGENANGIIENSYAMGSVSGGDDSFGGGLVGANSKGNENEFAVIDSSYSTGAVSAAGGSTIGGLIGEDLVGSGTTNSYWDLDTSGIGDPSKGAGNIANDPGITGLTTEQFQSGLPAGFAPSVWGENPTINGGFPYLLALQPN
jgi:hypothetical protein